MSMKKILRKERETFSIMTNMKEILGDFNALADARKKSSLLVKLAFGFCALTVSAVLFSAIHCSAAWETRYLW